MTRTCLSTALVALTAVVLSVCESLRADDVPSGRSNILFIMSDDHAAHAIGAYGVLFLMFDMFCFYHFLYLTCIYRSFTP